RYSTYWCTRGEPSTHAVALISQRQAIVVSIASADEFFADFAGKVTTLAEATDQRPLSTAMAVAELKRYLPDPSHRVRLHDLVMGEVARVIDDVALVDQDPNASPPTPDGVRERLASYERAEATLVVLAAVGGYFGDEPQHHALWTEM